MAAAFSGVLSRKSDLILLRPCSVLFCFAVTRGFCNNVTIVPFELRDSTPGNRNERFQTMNGAAFHRGSLDIQLAILYRGCPHREDPL